MKHLLLVDDNDKYARLLTEHFEPLGYTIERAIDAAEGTAKLRDNKGRYSVIVTDITMESQMAGVWMLGRIRPDEFTGTIVVASTGFDVPGVMTLSRLFFRAYGVHYLVPKTTVIKEEPLFYPMGFFSEPVRNFVEMTTES